LPLGTALPGGDPRPGHFPEAPAGPGGSPVHLPGGRAPALHLLAGRLGPARALGDVRRVTGAAGDPRLASLPPGRRAGAAGLGAGATPEPVARGLPAPTGRPHPERRDGPAVLRRAPSALRGRPLPVLGQLDVSGRRLGRPDAAQRLRPTAAARDRRRA